MVELVWLIPALPLAGFLFLVAFGRRIGEPGAGIVAAASMGGSFAATVAVYLGLRTHHDSEHRFAQTLFHWIPAGSFHVDMGFLVDPLSITMALFISGIATLIFIYAIGYMHGDENFSKFFIYLCLFAFSMLMLVLGSNLLVTFLGWEGVGACSYWLISFWFTDPANASAGKKAFIANRVGDWGFMVAMFLTFMTFGTLNYAGIASGAPAVATATATGIACFLFIGACGKSAQLPLYIWLPDAMAGPTPVSAMLHAATMVTAGVFLMCRMSPILHVAEPWVGTLIAAVGVVTALFAATIALGQNDIKKVLAYSTVSQLGYMFLAVGSGAYTAALFHMITHAFFKALLFLGAGSVIHGMHDEQDMRRMGALRKVMPITSITFIVGWLAIAGIPPFSGFWSKDEILAFAWQKSPVLWALGFVTAILTAFYMSRLVFMTFWGKARWNDPLPDDAHADDAHADEAHADEAHADHEVHPHESPWLMTLPLVVLAGLATLGGVIDLPGGTSASKILEHWLEPVLGHNERLLTISGAQGSVMAVATAVLCAAAIVFAFLVYAKGRISSKPFEQKILADGWGYDRAVSAFMGGPGRKFFDAVTWVDKTLVDGLVNGVGTVVRGGGERLRSVQTGYVRNYALGLALGAIVIVGFFLSKVQF